MELDGENYDARKEAEVAGWDRPGFQDAGWQAVRLFPGVKRPDTGRHAKCGVRWQSVSVSCGKWHGRIQVFSHVRDELIVNGFQLVRDGIIRGKGAKHRCSRGKCPAVRI